MNFPDSLSVCEWPKPWRIAFLFTLPISLPLWLVFIVILVMLCLTAFVVIAPITALAGIWKGENPFK